MRILAVKKPKRQKRHLRRRILAIFLLLVVAGVGNYARPLPTTRAKQVLQTSYPAQPISLSWPGYGQSAVATAELGVLATNGPQKPLATASIAKVITALCILEKYPLTKNQTGPTITLTGSDVAIYNNYAAKDGSVVAVADGEQLTERQLLQAMMLPSANNMADTAAAWAYTSLNGYISYANKFLATHGLTDTHVAVDASGFDGTTTSTASDLAKLGSLALAQPALAEIVSQPSATLPIVGAVYNYNGALGKDGIFGIKTGNNDQDAGAFLFAAKIPVGTTTITATGAVMGAGSLRDALTSAEALVASIKHNFSNLSVVHKNQVIGTYTTIWGTTTNAVATKDLVFTRWNAQPVSLSATIKDSQQAANAQVVGMVYATLPGHNQQVPLALDHPLQGPSFWWRVTRGIK